MPARLARSDSGGKTACVTSRRPSHREGLELNCTTVRDAGRSRRLADIALDQIDVDPAQVRQENDLTTEVFSEMCANVAAYGILQPLLVRPGNTPGRYTLIAGEFRYEAARQAGLTTLPCCIEEASLTQTDLYLRQLSENLHRQALSHMDLARAFQWLTQRDQDGGGLRAAELARRLGKSEAFISEHKKLMELSPADQQRLETGSLTFDEARLQLRSRSSQQETERPDRPVAQETAIPAPALGSARHVSDTAERTAPDPSSQERLSNGQFVYPRYSGCHPETKLTILVSGSDSTEPDLDRVVRTLERHLHFLKLKQRRQAASPAPGSSCR